MSGPPNLARAWFRFLRAPGIASRSTAAARGRPPGAAAWKRRGRQFLLLFGGQRLVESGVESGDGVSMSRVSPFGPTVSLPGPVCGDGCRRRKRFHVDQWCGRPDQRLERIRHEEVVGRCAGGRVNHPPVVPAPLEGVEAILPAAGPLVRIELGFRWRQLDLFEERFGPGGCRRGAGPRGRVRAGGRGTRRTRRRGERDRDTWAESSGCGGDACTDPSPSATGA